MTALIVIGVILLLLILIGLVRITVHIGYNERFSLLVSVFGITLYSTEQPKKENTDKKQTEKSSDKKENTVKKIYQQKGLKYTIDIFVNLLKTVVRKFKWFVKKLKIRNFLMSLSVVGSDAANTAITYGAVCSLIYPAITFIDTNLNFKAKKIDIYADFDNKDAKFSISTDIKASISVILVLALGCLWEFYNVYKTVKTDLDNKNLNK
ncbi:MAG: DUF2953 domain-containing protein [Ruminococcaceae bacterium]|nr:DUF2953 domain-containing protein [Oscillospiraceae bacterium]